MLPNQELETNPVVELFKEKEAFERFIYAIPSEENNTVSLDGLLLSLHLDESQERVAIHNIANVIREVINQHLSYSIEQFLVDVELMKNDKPELRYSQVLSNCIEITGILNEEVLILLYRLLSHFAAQQHYFLIELINMEIANGVKYGTNISSSEIISDDSIQNFIFNLQPFKTQSEREMNYSNNQGMFISMYLLNAALFIAEGVFRAEKEMQKVFGFQFN